MSPCPFSTTITITPRAPGINDTLVLYQTSWSFVNDDIRENETIKINYLIKKELFDENWKWNHDIYSIRNESPYIITDLPTHKRARISSLFLFSYIRIYIRRETERVGEKERVKDNKFCRVDIKIVFQENVFNSFLITHTSTLTQTRALTHTRELTHTTHRNKQTNTHTHTHIYIYIYNNGLIVRLLFFYKDFHK